MGARWWYASVLIACVAGCASVPARPPAGQPAAAKRVVPLPLGTTYTGGEVLQRSMPIYPATMVSACPSGQDVEVIAYIDTGGEVSRVYGYAIDAFPPPWGTFYAAVRPAVLQWRFAPLRVAHWAADASGNPRTVDGGTRRFTRHLAFHFTCDHGRTKVTATLIGRAAARSSE